MVRRFLVIGHRGAAGHAPENTIAAFDRALAMGVDGVETDIRATRDGVLVLLHDATVDRTTRGSGAVADLTWAELEGLDAGARFAGGGHPFGVQRIPRLDTFLDRYGGRTSFRLEIKARGGGGSCRPPGTGAAADRDGGLYLLPAWGDNGRAADGAGGSDGLPVRGRGV